MKKLLSTTIAVGIFASISFSSAAFANVDPGTLPQLGSKGPVDATVTHPSDKNLNVKLKEGNNTVGQLYWSSFDVGKDATVNFEFTGNNQTALNRVEGNNMSQIYGHITQSGCVGCGYEASGKVILLNPNGVFFGDGANVNLNSFTASTFDGDYDAETGKLKLDRAGRTTEHGITVADGAELYGDKTLAFVSDKVHLLKGSQLKTDGQLGKIKIVTADGVHFTYANTGTIAEVDPIKASTDKMTVSVEGDLTSGHIDIRNMSTNDESVLSVKGANLKATKAVNGNDGKIWLTSANDVLIEDANLTTSNLKDTDAAREGGDIIILAGRKISSSNSNITSASKMDITSKGGDVVIADNSKLKAAKDITISAANIANVKTAADVSADNVKITGKDVRISTAGTVNADKDITLEGDNIWFHGATLKAGNEINGTAKNGYVQADNYNDKVTSLDAKKITLKAKTDVKGTMNLNNKQSNLYAEHDINVNLKNVGERNNGLVAEAQNNVDITTDGDLSVSRLVAKNGNMNLNVGGNVLSGAPKTTETLREEGDSTDRAYIEVGGEFNVNKEYNVSDSADPTPDQQFNKRHHIEFGTNKDEKILLVNKKPASHNEPAVDPEGPYADESQASRLVKLPKTPETYNNKANVADGRTSFVDVFAAASQIEIVDDEEEE